MAQVLAQTNVGNYRPGRAVLILNGVVVEGIASGGVVFSFTDDLNTVTVGLDGSWLFTTKEAFAGTCTINLLPTSPAIPIFDAILAANKYNDSGTFLLVYKSDNGKKIITMPAARFAKQSDETFADAPTDRVYMAISGNMEVTAA